MSDPNKTLVERLQDYVEKDQHQKAVALARLGDFLEACYEWEVSFNTDFLDN